MLTREQLIRDEKLKQEFKKKLEQFTSKMQPFYGCCGLHQFELQGLVSGYVLLFEASRGQVDDDAKTFCEFEKKVTEAMADMDEKLKTAMEAAKGHSGQASQTPGKPPSNMLN